MTSEMRRYAAYRSVDLPIAAAVPAHWSLRRLRTTTQSIRNGIWGNDPDGEHDFPCVRVADFSRYEYRVRMDHPTIRSITPAERQTRLLRPGDLLLEKSGGGDQQPVGAVMLYDHPIPAVCSNFVAQVKPAPGFDSRYLVYLHACLYSVRLNVRSIKQTTGIQNLDSDSYFSELVPLAPSQEQAAIARYLDVQSAQIAALIRNKRRLIALLNEEKQAIIQQAVTRGLDSDGPMKLSGVEWLGEIPAHWSVARLGRHMQMTTGFPFKSDHFSHDDADIRLLRGVNVAIGRIRWDSVVYWPMNQRINFSEYELRESDIVLGMDRPIIRGGVRVAKIQEGDIPSLLLQRVARIRPNAGLDSDYLLLQLAGSNFSEYIAPIFTGISVPHLSPEQISEFRFALPELPEQVQIIRHVTDRTESITAAITKANSEIDLIREYRTRLIADVVTGQLDVREAAASLPDIEDTYGDSLLTDTDGLEVNADVADQDLDLIESADAAD